MKLGINNYRLGIIGMSDGNGHPYSWSAIMNGYTSEMDNCPFPAIPAYLRAEKYPDRYIHNAQVTHIWTQDSELSKHIAMSSNIENVCANRLDMIGEVDGVLLARDDAENHWDLGREFLEAGLPIYIDKPVAHTIAGLDKLLQLEKYSGQLFTCSALRYAKELMLSEKDLVEIGDIKIINAITPKSWQKYAVHIIEPLVTQFGTMELRSVNTIDTGDKRQLTALYKNDIILNISAVGSLIHPIQLEFIGTKAHVVKRFSDSFSAFKSSIEAFLECLEKKDRIIPIDETRSIVNIIEQGLKQ